MPQTCTGAKTVSAKQETASNKKNIKMAPSDKKEPTLKDIFDMVKATNTIVAGMGLRMKTLEEEGKPQMKVLSDKIDDLTKGINNYTDHIDKLEKTVEAQDKNKKTLVKLKNLKVTNGPQPCKRGNR